MIEATRTALAGQFAAALDMLGNAIDACPDAVWLDESREPRFWYVAHHTLFWTDYYLSDALASYAPPAPFGLEELDPAGVLPPRPSTRDELQRWLAHCRSKADTHIAGLTSENVGAPAGFPRLGLSRIELLLYNLRHVHHHVGQLNLLLRQRTDSAPRWVRRGGDGVNRG